MKANQQRFVHNLCPKKTWTWQNTNLKQKNKNQWIKISTTTNMLTSKGTIISFARKGTIHLRWRKKVQLAQKNHHHVDLCSAGNDNIADMQEAKIRMWFAHWQTPMYVENENSGTDFKMNTCNICEAPAPWFPNWPLSGSCKIPRINPPRWYVSFIIESSSSNTIRPTLFPLTTYIFKKLLPKIDTGMQMEQKFLKKEHMRSVISNLL